MKQFYNGTILAICLIVFNFTQAQTYNINSSGNGDCGTGGIDGPYICATYGQPAVDLGTFTDTNAPGEEITSMTLVVYNACNGEFEIFLNGVSIATGTNSGTGCSCETIASNSNITNTIDVTLTPAIIAAYVAGGSNTLSVSTSISTQCFYGADVTVTTGTLDVNELDYSTVKIFPNPVLDRITVKGLIKSENYKIYDIIGNEILKGEIDSDKEIEFKNFAKGLYYLKFENGNTLKFIKR
ncbi:Por secretion system C-terminal sorting domain-containing protein [Lutibacter oricola]|uniref:Por secretion system C-terminal sorting domain-containing protein n=1 Tax=Lutibacter oricola TaxID=762486 RepID=A0A1H3E838_9FLAO|nr:T9SS type A sorting domain-containing protein [Lutibacter oricola]SDX74932.1 Por secretion system C-terminal sorting domain-containing protein [Lutibacter oricola]